MPDIGDRIMEKLTQHGERLASIETEMKSTSTGLNDLNSKVDDIRTGKWDCPQGSANALRIDRLEQDDRDQWQKINAKPTVVSNGPGGWKPSGKQIAAISAGGVPVLGGMGYVVFQVLSLILEKLS